MEEEVGERFGECRCEEEGCSDFEDIEVAAGERGVLMEDCWGSSREGDCEA